MKARDIIVKPISRLDADRIVKSCHYSGKVVQNSQLHFGVFLDGKCGGAMQFGPSLMKTKVQGLVSDTAWNGFIELNRMAFADWLPRNSESRAIGAALRIIRKTYPQIEWVLSFADSTQCGDGTIYRASGFHLTGIKKNNSIIQLPTGECVAKTAYTKGRHILSQKGRAGIPEGAKFLQGFQLRYIYFLNPDAKNRLTVPILPFSEIQRRGAGMYKGKPRATSIDSDAVNIQLTEGGATPTVALNTAEVQRG